MASRISAMLAAALIAASPAAQAVAQTASSDTTSAPAAPPAAAATQQTDMTKETPPAPAAPADAAPVQAAETPAADSAAPAATEGAAPASDTAAPAAAPDAAQSSDEPMAGSYYTKSTHGDWLLRCLKAPDGKDPCELYQLMKDADGSPVAEVSVIPFTGKAAAIVNFVAPLETDLSTGIGLQIDNGKNAAYPFMVCARIGCIARIGMTEAELGALKKGNAASVSLLPFGGEPDKNTVKLNLSLKGFTAGFDELQKVVKAQQ